MGDSSQINSMGNRKPAVAGNENTGELSNEYGGNISSIVGKGSRFDDFSGNTAKELYGNDASNEKIELIVENPVNPNPGDTGSGGSGDTGNGDSGNADSGGSGNETTITLPAVPTPQTAIPNVESRVPPAVPPTIPPTVPNVNDGPLAYSGVNRENTAVLTPPSAAVSQIDLSDLSSAKADEALTVAENDIPKTSAPPTAVREPELGNIFPEVERQTVSSNAIIIILIVVAVAVVALGVLVFVKRKKSVI